MSRRHLLISIIILIIAALPVVYQTGQTPLNYYDEARRAVNAAEMLENGNLLVPYYDGVPDMWGTKPSLLVGLQAMSMRVFGVNRISARLPSFLFTIALYLLLIRYTAKIGKIEWGWLAVMMLATTTGFINHHGARSGDFEPMLCFWTTIVVLYFYKYLLANQVRSKNTYFSLAVLALVLACLTKGIAGLLFLPGIFVFTLFQKKLLKVLQDWRLWIGTVLFFSLVFGYYLLREQYNPGYLQTVWENEIGGRYGSTLEEHQGPDYYYLALLFQTYFMPWILLLPLLPSVWKQKPVFFSYLAVVITTFILVISFSETKISWYLYPTLPFFALLMAPCIIKLKTIILKWLPVPNRIPIPYSGYVFYFILLFIPYLLIFNRIDKRRTRDLESGHIAYGLYIDHHLGTIDSLYMPKLGYNPNALFQTKRLKAKGKFAERIPVHDSMPKGYKLLICEDEVRSSLKAKYEIIHQSEYCTLVLIK